MRESGLGLDENQFELHINSILGALYELKNKDKGDEQPGPPAVKETINDVAADQKGGEDADMKKEVETKGNAGDDHEMQIEEQI